MTLERLAELRQRATERDAAHHEEVEPEALCDDDILTRLDIEEIHKEAQKFRGDAAGRSMREVAEFEMVCSRSEYVCMAEALLRASEERDRLRESLDVSRYVERTNAFLARAHAAEAQRDALLKVVWHCWEWFDDHDDRMTSAELHRMLAAAKEAP